MRLPKSPTYTSANDTGVQFSGMKRHTWPLAALLIASLTCLPQSCKASESACDNSPRMIGAFGAEDRPLSPVTVAAAIRSQLTDLHDLRRVLDTHLSPSGEQVVFYDSDPDESDPHPKVAIMVGGRVVKSFDAGQFKSPQRRLRTLSVELRIQPHKPPTSAGSLDVNSFRWRRHDFRQSSAGSRAATRWCSNPMVAQGRMEFGSLKLHLWRSVSGGTTHSRNSDSAPFECMWCPHHYVVTEYLWRNGRYVKAGSKRTSNAYDPSEITGTSLAFKAPQAPLKRAPPS